MTDDPRSYNAPQLRSLQIDDIDGLGRAIVSLAMEVGILNDRLAALEDVLAVNGIDAARLVDAHVPSEQAQHRVDQTTHRIIRNVLASMVSD